MPIPPKAITVLTDQREKIPVKFPATLIWYNGERRRNHHVIAVRVVKKTLKTGDYYIEGYRDVSIVERKRAAEIGPCALGVDVRRFRAQLDRLTTTCRFPYLLIDSSPAKVMRATKWCAQPEKALSLLLRECARRSVRIMWAGNCYTATSRRILGEVLLRIMLTHILVEPWVMPVRAPSVTEEPLPC